MFIKIVTTDDLERLISINKIKYIRKKNNNTEIILDSDLCIKTLISFEELIQKLVNNNIEIL